MTPIMSITPSFPFWKYLVKWGICDLNLSVRKYTIHDDVLNTDSALVCVSGLNISVYFDKTGISEYELNERISTAIKTIIYNKYGLEIDILGDDQSMKF